jgi:hypothetical protein
MEGWQVGENELGVHGTLRIMFGASAPPPRRRMRRMFVCGCGRVGWHVGGVTGVGTDSLKCEFLWPHFVCTSGQWWG